MRLIGPGPRVDVKSQYGALVSVITGMQGQTRGCSVPDGIGGGGGGRSELVLLSTALGGPLSFIPYSLDSLERVRGREDPREALGDSVFSILEL